VPIPELIADVLARAAHLVALALAPPLFPPEPAPTSPVVAFIATAALATLVAGATRLRARIPTRASLAAASLLILSVVISIVSAVYFRGPRAPLGRGLLFVAIPLWAGLAATAALVVRPPRRSLVAGAVLGLGALLCVASSSWLFSTPRMWWETLLRDGDAHTAIEAILAPSLAARDNATALAALDRCLTLEPSSCACAARRAVLRIKAHELEAAASDARSAAERCPRDPRAQAALAASLIASGEAKRGEEVARAALVDADMPELHHTLALALDQEGRPKEALASARKAVEKGGGRDATLLLGALLIRDKDFASAKALLTPLAGPKSNDAEALYDLGLIADLAEDYNQAREHYLAALRADPSLSAARYNLALLTLRRGVVDEARHHARKFVEADPTNPRGAELVRRIEVTASARAKPVAPP